MDRKGVRNCRMISESLLKSSDTLVQEFGLYVDSLPSVSSGDTLINGENEYEIIASGNNTGQAYSDIYVSYNGGFQVYTDAEQVPDFIALNIFMGFALGIILCAICSIFRVSIDFFSSIIK